MLGYVTIGTNDLPRAAAFYEELAKELGVPRMMESDGFVAWGEAGSPAAGLGVTKPFNGEAASVGNGVMVALAAKDRAQVDRLHAKALALGGTCEGPPGVRMPGFYAAYFRDLDGNKLNAFVMEQPPAG
jgi:catechol 2,3-dioxygenase-like lactoylglutathione lyase family enzyme